jgi:carbon monoxide dehydrogenase subunit G
MVTFEKSVFINRPQQEVFDFVMDLNNDAKWQSSIEAVEQISAETNGVGSTWRYKVKFLGREIEADTEVTSFDPPNQASVKSSGMVPFENTYTFETMDNGTQLTFNGQAEVGGFFKLAEGMIKKQFKKQMDADAVTLKKLLEAG